MSSTPRDLPGGPSFGEALAELERQARELRNPFARRLALRRIEEVRERVHRRQTAMLLTLAREGLL